MHSPPEEEAVTRAPHTSFCAKAEACTAAVGALVEGVLTALTEAKEEDFLKRHQVDCETINTAMHY